MNRTKINAAMCGATLGKKILMIQRNPVDPNYSDDKKNDVLRLSRPIFLYSIKPIDVTCVELVVTTNNETKVEFNKNPQLRLDVANIDDINKVIPVPSAQTVKSAIERYERSNREEVTIFTDYEKLLREVIALNTEEKKTLNNFIQKQMKFCATLTEANETEITACKVSLKEFGIEVNI